MTYASPAFFYALPLYLKKDLENVEKRALSIIFPGLAYRKALELSNIMSINDYIASLFKKTFLSIANDPAHRLHNMLQSSGPSCYNLWCKRRFTIPKCKTERFKNCWFSHDVTKIQTKKLSILPRNYFHDALEQLKTNFHTNFRFKRVLGFVIEDA